MVLATNLGFPRIGINRELKRAIEAYWKGKLPQNDLMRTAKSLRLSHWKMQKDAGISHIPSNDFSFYDQVLDMACVVGCVPARYEWTGGEIDIDLYSAMARGNDKAPAMEMTKWFDTNYHYIVPEFEDEQSFTLSSTKIFDEYLEAKEAGIDTRPVILGPVSFLYLGKGRGETPRVKHLEKLLAVYDQIFAKLAALGAGWVQVDEPVLCLDLDKEWIGAYETAKATFAKASDKLNILIATYFEGMRDNLDLALSLPVAGIHLDLRRAPEQLDEVLEKIGKDKVISLGLIDGRNIWKNDLSQSLEIIEKAAETVGSDRLFIAPSCSLLHTPFDLDLETELDPQIKDWLAFSKQKLGEIHILTKAANDGKESVASVFESSDKTVEARRSSGRIHDQKVKKRIENIDEDMRKRQSPYAERRIAQQNALGLPLYPTTTIGSFPQTQEIRKARADYRKGDLDRDGYEAAIKKEIQTVIQYQEEIGMDVLVHGEAERNDMVEYFGEKLSGFTFTKNGWVQSYGSRCVKPPIIFGDVSRPQPMTVDWSIYAQSLTDKPMKGMLTGPITILCWSFVRDDQPRSETCRQIALAIRDEVVDLEKAGITVIQIDEPAIREGLPLRREDWDAYLSWAVESFRLASCGVKDSTQIHTHMCYSEFNDIIDSIAALDADALSVETSRSHMEILEAFREFNYPNEIGPGVYDIHSPRIPSVEEMVDLLEKASAVLKAEQLWVNPDCGLKTRRWEEVKPALKNMVDAAKAMREEQKAKCEAA